MNATNNYLSSNSATFLPKHTYRVIERKTTATQHRDGSIERTMTETIVMQFNEDLIAKLLAENSNLKYQLEEARHATVSFDFENYTVFAMTALFICWKLGAI